MPSEYFHLILQGAVVVCSGKEGFMVELGPFNYMGLESLNNKDLYGAASAKTRFSSCASNWFEEGFLVNFFLQMSYIFLI